jgi:hypothetical protein
VSHELVADLISQPLETLETLETFLNGRIDIMSHVAG